MSRIAFVLADDFEDPEFRQPHDAMVRAGHQVTVIGARKGEEVKGRQRKERARVDTTADELRPEEFAALIIPGGYSPDRLRLVQPIVAFTRAMCDSGRLVAAVCHGPQLLIEADVVRNKTMTSWPSVQKDLENAGARWVNLQVCICENLITSRKPEDLEAFSDAILEQIRERKGR